VTPFLRIGALRKKDFETDSRCNSGEEVAAEAESGAGGGTWWRGAPPPCRAAN
jgi:hypothetical protein